MRGIATGWQKTGSLYGPLPSAYSSISVFIVDETTTRGLRDRNTPSSSKQIMLSLAT